MQRNKDENTAEFSSETIPAKRVWRASGLVAAQGECTLGEGTEALHRFPAPCSRHLLHRAVSELLPLPLNQ